MKDESDILVLKVICPIASSKDTNQTTYMEWDMIGQWAVQAQQ